MSAETPCPRHVPHWQHRNSSTESLTMFRQQPRGCRQSAGPSELRRSRAHGRRPEPAWWLETAPPAPQSALGQPAFSPCVSFHVSASPLESTLKCHLFVGRRHTFPLHFPGDSPISPSSHVGVLKEVTSFIECPHGFMSHTFLVTSNAANSLFHPTQISPKHANPRVRFSVVHLL